MMNQKFLAARSFMYRHSKFQTMVVIASFIVTHKHQQRTSKVFIELSKKKEFDNVILNKSPIKIRRFRITNKYGSKNVMNEGTQLTIT